MKRLKTILTIILFFSAFFLKTGCRRQLATINQGEPIRTIEEWKNLDKSPIQHVICSGSGSLRLICYLDAADKIVAVEQIEKESSGTSPYRRVHPEFAELPTFGEGHGRDNIEILLTLNPKPDAIIRIDNPGSGIDPRVLQEKTGIPVILVPYGDLGQNRKLLNEAILFLGEVLGKQERANSLIAFWDTQIDELSKRARSVSLSKQLTAYLGGLSYRGTHGINSTTSAYPPFDWLNLKNPATSLDIEMIQSKHVMISREQLIAWNPDFIFVDLGTLETTDVNGLTELKKQPVYRSLNALKKGRVCPLYPNNSYNTNFDVQLANAWFIGNFVYPEQFEDVDVDEKMKSIYQFMIGDPFLHKFPDTLKPVIYQPITTSSETNL